MSGTPPGGAKTARLREAIEPVVTAAGLDLEELRSEAAGKYRMVRVIVDGDGGVTLDDIAELSQRISARLDESDAAGGAAYVLEVTSPGVDRPLTAPRHWRRARGRLVKMRLVDGGERKTGELVGRITASDEKSVTLDVDGAGRDLAGTVTIPFADVASARVQVEFARPAGVPAPGGEIDTTEIDDAGDEFDDVDEDLDEDLGDADDVDDVFDVDDTTDTTRVDGQDDTAADTDRRAGRRDED